MHYISEKNMNRWGEVGSLLVSYITIFQYSSIMVLYISINKSANVKVMWKQFSVINICLHRLV